MGSEYGASTTWKSYCPEKEAVKLEIKYGTEVLDRHGKALGKVDHLMRNTLSGEISKFVVCRKAPLRDVFLSPQDVLEFERSKVRVNVSIDELGEIT